MWLPWRKTGSCAIKSSRKRHFQEFFRVKKQTANCRIHEVLRSTSRPSQPSILERSHSFYRSCQAQALSPNYFCKEICFPMNGGGKQNQLLRMECVILGTDVVGVLSLISPYRQFLEQVETSEMLFDLCQILLYTHTLTERPSNTWVRSLLCQRGTFSETIIPCAVSKMCWQLIGWTRWLSCISPAVILLCYVKASYCTLMRGFLFLLFPVSLTGPISTFQITQLSTGASLNEKNIFYSM